MTYIKRKKGVILTAVVLTITVWMGFIVLEEQHSAIEDLVEEKCTEKFGDGNWTWVSDGTSHFTDTSPYSVRCKNKNTGEIYEPRIVLKGSNF